MPSFHEFCISLNGQFYFRIKDEFRTRERCAELLKDLRTRFPVSDGFKVELSYWECTGRTVSK
jgi:hypothetical protein